MKTTQKIKIKKIKPVSKESKLRIQIENLEYELKEQKMETRKAIQNYDSLNSTMSAIKSVLNCDSSYSKHDRDVLAEITKLVAFREMWQGSEMMGGRTIEMQKDIIRWMINPETADQSKELDYYKKDAISRGRPIM